MQGLTVSNDEHFVWEIADKPGGKYPKIQSIFKRDPETKYKTFLDEFTCDEFMYLADNLWEATEKIDGTNIRIVWDGGTSLIMLGRSDKAQVPKRLTDKYIRDDKIFEKFTEHFTGLPMTLYGEGYGAGIQGGGKYIQNDQAFILFDVLINDHWQERDDTIDIAEKLDIEVVPTVGIMDLYGAVEIVREGITSLVAEEPMNMEGVVLRPTVELQDRCGSRIITKVKTKDFPNG